MTRPIRPLRSAIGMNSSGGMNPSSAWFHRTSASTLTVSPVGELRLRLDVHLDPALVERGAQLGHEHEPAGVVRVGVGLVEPQAPGGGLGVVHRHVGPLEQAGRVRGVGRGHRQAQRAAHLDLEPVERHRLLQRAQQPPADADGAVLVVDAAQQDGELVPAQAGDEAGRADRGAQPRADLDEQQVAVLVTQGVVDLLEAGRGRGS